MALHWLKNLFLCNALNTSECPSPNGLLLYALSHAHRGKAGIPIKVMSGGLGNYIWGPLCTLEFLLFRATIASSFLQFIYKVTEAQRGEATCLRTHSKSVVELGLEFRPLPASAVVFSTKFACPTFQSQF